MPATHILAPHDDGRLWVARLLDQYRDRRDGTWRVVVTYNTGPGQTYIRALPAELCRAVDDPPPGWADPRERGRTSAPAHVTPAGTATRTESTWLW